MGLSGGLTRQRIAFPQDSDLSSTDRANRRSPTGELTTCIAPNLLLLPNGFCFRFFIKYCISDCAKLYYVFYR